MAVLNKRAIVTAIEMYGVTAIRLGSTPKPALDVLIKALFTSGEQGFAYDPNDLSTLYQDAAGTIPVTAVGQPVGLMLDKSKGLVLGGELVPITVAARANTSVEYIGNKIKITCTAVGGWGIDFKFNASTVPSYFYKVVGNLTIAASDQVYLRVVTGQATIRSAGLLNTIERSSGVSSGALALTSGLVGDYVELELSVKHIAGNPAFQTVSASRPILRKNDVTGAYYLEFDGTDDYLIVAKDNLKFLHDGTGAAGFVGFKPSGAAVYHTLLNTGDLGSASRVGYALSQDDRRGTGYILNVIAKGSSPLHVNNAYTSGVSTNPRVISFKNKIGTHVLRLNGTEVFNSPTEIGVPNTTESTNDLWIGRAPAGFSLHGNVYGLICINRLTTDSETTVIEKELAKNTGGTLNV